MTYIVDLDAFELQPKDDKVFNNFIDDARVLDTQLIEIHCYSKVYIYIYIYLC